MLVTQGTRHRRQLGSGDRHAEQAHRERVHRLHIGQRGHGAFAQQAAQHLVHIGADLHHAAADEHRAEVAQHFADVRRVRFQPQLEPRHQCQHGWELHAELQRAADDRAPGQIEGEAALVQIAIPDHGRDHGDVPDHGRGVGEEEFAVAVQDPQAPGREDQQARAGKQHAHQPDRELALLAGEAGGDREDEVGSGGDPHEHDQRGDYRQDRANGACHPARLFFLALGQQVGIDRNERGRKHALAEQVL